MPSALLHPFAKPTRDSFRRIVRGEGALIWDSEGRQYIDGMASLWYCAIGHGRAEMAAAISDQVTKIEAYSIFDPYTNEPAEAIADKLASIAPTGPGTRVFLTCSGSEAIDTVMKFARMAHVLNGQPQRKLIISRGRGYHGTAYGGTSAQGIAPNRENFGPFVGDVVQVPPDDIEAMASLMAERGDEVAAIITEPVQGAAGVYPPTPGYLEGLRRLCDQHGAFLVFDEVITGFGRLGSWFAAHHYGVQPDFATFAKAVTSGYQPLGGVFCGPKAVAAFESDATYFLRHGFTYSGHPTVCAASLKNIEIIEREGLLERATLIGARLGAGLNSLASDGIVAAVRGEGAVWAVDHHAGVDPAAIRDRMADDGVITRNVGTVTNTFCPPLVTTEAQIDQIVDTLARVTQA